MRLIEPPDSHCLSAAIGWLELGNCQEAMLELDQMHEELRSHPVVLQARYDIHAKAGQWNEAAEIATRLLELSPANCGAWTGLSYATRRKQGGGIPQAKEILLKAAARFPKEPLIAYNLACYECQLGNLDQPRCDQEDGRQRSGLETVDDWLVV